MRNVFKALAKELFGVRYEKAGRSLLTAWIVFFAIRATEWRLAVSPSILYLTSFVFPAGVMWQTLGGRRHMEIVQGMLLLPLENRSFVLGYASALGAHALLTKTLPVWALFLAAASWNGPEIAAALLCGCMACAVTAASFAMCRRGWAGVPILWAAGILAVIVAARRTLAVLAVAGMSLPGAMLCLCFADAWAFYNSPAAKKAVRHTGRTGSVFVYLARYLTANRSACINSAGLCAVACGLPLLFGEVQGLNSFPIGLAILCLNTPACTLLSGDPDLEQALRALPGQAGRFWRGYCAFLFAVNGAIAAVYVCSWHLLCGGADGSCVGLAVLFALQSAVLSVLLEWKYPIRGWKTESDLWHHPRKYLVPLGMLLLAALVGTWRLVLWVWPCILLLSCGGLLYAIGR